MSNSNKSKQKIFLSSLDGIDFKFEANWMRDNFCYVTRTVRNIFHDENDYEYGVVKIDGVKLVVMNDGNEWSVDKHETHKLHHEAK